MTPPRKGFQWRDDRGSTIQNARGDAAPVPTDIVIGITAARITGRGVSSTTHWIVASGSRLNQNLHRQCSRAQLSGRASLGPWTSLGSVDDDRLAEERRPSRLQLGDPGAHVPPVGRRCEGALARRLPAFRLTAPFRARVRISRPLSASSSSLHLISFPQHARPAARRAGMPFELCPAVRGAAPGGWNDHG